MSRVLVLAAILLFAAYSTAIGLQSASAQLSQGITVNPDGSLTPSTSPIQVKGGVYILTADLDVPVTVNRVGITIDGANRTLKGPGMNQNLIGITLTAWNVTVENLLIAGWRAGVYGAFDNNTITHCCFENNMQSIALYGGNYVIKENSLTTSSTAVFISGDNNLITHNQISGNTEGAFDILKGTNTTITQNNVTDNNIILVIATYTGHNILYDNNFLDNVRPLLIPFGGPTLLGVTPISPAGLWDNGNIGNYWSDYSTKYPNATEIDNTGIGNTQYAIEYAVTGTSTYANGTQTTQTVIWGTAVDHYPQMTPVSFASTSSPQPTASPQQTTPTPSPSATPTPTRSPTLVTPTSTPTIGPSIPEFPIWIIPLTIAITAIVCLARGKTIKAFSKRDSYSVAIPYSIFKTPQSQDRLLEILKWTYLARFREAIIGWRHFFN